MPSFAFPQLHHSPLSAGLHFLYAAPRQTPDGECFTGYCQRIVGFFTRSAPLVTINEDRIDNGLRAILIFGRVIIIGTHIDALNILTQPLFIVGAQTDTHFLPFGSSAVLMVPSLPFHQKRLNTRNGVRGREIVFFLALVRNGDWLITTSMRYPATPAYRPIWSVLVTLQRQML